MRLLAQGVWRTSLYPHRVCFPRGFRDSPDVTASLPPVYMPHSESPLGERVDPMLRSIGMPLFLGLMLAPTAGPAIGPEPGAPVAATVSEEMAQHQQATYWFVLKEQADLSRARGIKS